MVARLRHHVGDAVIEGKGIVDVRTVSKDVSLSPSQSRNVRRAPSKADYYVDSVADIHSLLEELIKIS
ncbi:hypothetical protein MTO96_009297 [Rhipicephalus appendiculatus]